MNQARFSCSVVQGSMPLFFVPSGQVVLFHIAPFRFARHRNAAVRTALLRSAPYRFALNRKVPARRA